jgi:subtilisin family serine protease
MDPELWELLEAGDDADEIAAILRLGQPGVVPEGVRVVSEFGDIITGRMERGAIPAVRETAECTSMKSAGAPLGPDIELVEDAREVPEPATPHDDRRPDSVAATGRGVVVGVIDWGFDFAHPDFRQADGSSRIEALWDQRGPMRPGSPEPFRYGFVHTREAINRALQSAEPYAALGYHPADADPGAGSHGTHVASIAAGNGGGGGPIGIAPEAALVLVHLATWSGQKAAKLGDSVTLLEAIDFIARLAGPRPWVINLSMGRHGEQHDGTTLVEQALDAALRSAPGRAICQSGGNYFHRGIHSSGQLRPGERQTLRWEVFDSDVTPNEMEIWYSWRDTFEVEVRSPDGSASVRAKLGERVSLNAGGRELGKLYHRAREPNTLDNHIEVLLYKGAPPGQWKVTLVGADVIDGRFHAWIERDAACPGCQSRFARDDSDPSCTTGTICNGMRTFAVGAYNPHEPDLPLGVFSSAGPTRDGRIKPDLCAPGVAILAARSAPRRFDGERPLLTRMSGTSMAAPHVTGTVALMFEVAPRPLRIEETHNLLLSSARKVSPESSARAGSGYLDIEAAVECARKVGGSGMNPTREYTPETSAMNQNELSEEELCPECAGRRHGDGASVRRSEEESIGFGAEVEAEFAHGLYERPAPEEEPDLPEMVETSFPRPVYEADAAISAGNASVRTPVRARIIWPALGFPAVITPQNPPSNIATLEVDATRCITVLLLSNRRYLSKEEAARYLRYAPWGERHRRHIPAGGAGSFKEEELVVSNDEGKRKLTIPKPESCGDDPEKGNYCYGDLIKFGENAIGDDARNDRPPIIVNLSHYVRNFYRDQGIEFLHEIRVSEEASARLQGLDRAPPGGAPHVRYQLFWNNEATNENAPSDEMGLLLNKFARPRREKLGKLWEKRGSLLMNEYEREYGAFHPPYAPAGPHDVPRAEVLHPLFVARDPGATLRIAHLTDTHVDVRADVYEENLKRHRLPASYNNWNTNFINLYEHARRDCDVVFLTGDLIDYGRGHWGPEWADALGYDGAYHVDRNWFLFYSLLAAGDAYTRPAYTILGNHDWRLNPYPPFAIVGPPKPRDLFHDYAQVNTEKREGEERKATQLREKVEKLLELYLRRAHGEGSERGFSYRIPAENKVQLFLQETGTAVKTLIRMIGQTKGMDVPGSPAETTVESVAWYLLSINPFLDYSFSLPQKHRVLMLDWGEKEDVLFPIIRRGRTWPYLIWQAEEAAAPGPKAARCLTPLQQSLVSMFIGARGKAKIIGIHAPPIGPYPDWDDGALLQGRNIYEELKDARGRWNLGTRRPDGTVVKLNGHPTFAIRPNDEAFGEEADYGSFGKNRAWFIRELAKPGSGVRMVLSGHIHRNGLYVVHKGGGGQESVVRGQLLIRGVRPQLAQGAHPPAVTRTPEGQQGPLYVNTTSGGPRGHWFPEKEMTYSADPGYTHLELTNDGTIQRVEFRPPQRTAGQPGRIVQQPQVAPALA